MPRATPTVSNTEYYSSEQIGCIPPLASMVYLDVWQSTQGRMRLSWLSTVCSSLAKLLYTNIPKTKSESPHRYWDWTLDVANIEVSPLFDGSSHSLSGNGLPNPSRSNLIALTISLPSVPLSASLYLLAPAESAWPQGLLPTSPSPLVPSSRTTPSTPHSSTIRKIWNTNLIAWNVTWTRKQHLRL